MDYIVGPGACQPQSKPIVGNLKLVTRVTAGEQVAVQVAELISDGRWGPGEELPGEADLPVFQYRPVPGCGRL
jgi:hypothetical protein